MKKEYHYTISRTDRIYLVTFCITLLSWELVKKAFPNVDRSYTYISQPVEKKKSYSEKDNQYYSSSYHAKNKKYTNNSKRKHFSYAEKENNQLSPPSEPMHLEEADFDVLLSMGFSKKVAFNIQKYLSSGGKIYSAEQLLKIYGMDSLQLQKAIPYIIFPERNFTSSSTNQNFSKQNISVIDLNTASKEELESLQGIGTALAERIIKFRESLGGFIYPEQLKDCYGLPPETFEQIKPHIQANGSPKMIAINETNLSTFVHPYLSKKLARMIQAYKDHHGPFVNAEELRKVYPADTTWCNKLLPYLSFEIVEDNN